MKKILFIMVVCFAVAVKGFAQEATKTEKEEKQEVLDMKFDETTHDVGTIEYNGKAEYEFTFTNMSKEPIIIQRCSSGCGCTVPTCPKEKPIKPGEKGTIKVKYLTTNVASPFMKDVTVYSNAKNSPVKLTIKGVVAQKVENKDVSEK
ncbi:MAG: DUF1573 domain-containing protein [Bacteroidales bacterium]|jgi:hypothetical protein|nr:DUF1573 domain-containing protein [Bacteroidales bacterium]